MNKRIKRKHFKGIFYHHRGSMLWQFHAYQNPDSRLSNREVMLLYGPDGNELYFKKMKEAKRFIRTMPKIKELNFEDF